MRRSKEGEWLKLDEKLAEILVLLLEKDGGLSGLFVSGRGQLGVASGRSAVESDTWAY